MYGTVIRTEWLTPGLVRVTLGGGGLDDFAMIPDTDTYINIAIPPRGAPYGTVFDPAEIQKSFTKDLWPARRRYTIRAFRADPAEIDVDFVVHGDSGIAGPWAAEARAGDKLVFTGPAGGYRPDPTTDWHLMIGDESALPAIAASLEALPDRALALVRLVCDSPAHRVELDSPATLDVQWSYREDEPDAGHLLLKATQELEFPQGRVHAFVHGEAEEIRGIRRHLLVDRGLARSNMSCSPYWRRNMTDEAWRTIKRDFVAAMEAENGMSS